VSHLPFLPRGKDTRNKNNSEAEAPADIRIRIRCRVIRIPIERTRIRSVIRITAYQQHLQAHYNPFYPKEQNRNAQRAATQLF